MVKRHRIMSKIYIIVEDFNEYEDLDDTDTFEDGPDGDGYDPVYDEIDYQYLGPREGKEFSFRGNTYRLTDGIIYQDNNPIARVDGDVPFEEFMWNGSPHLGGNQPWSWRELFDDLTNVFGRGDWDAPPGVPVYEDFDEYEGLDDEDTFEAEPSFDNAIWMEIRSVLDDVVTDDDLINAAREVLARAGYEVGEFEITDRNTSPHMRPWIVGSMDLPDYSVWRPREFSGHGVEIEIPTPA